MRCEEIMKRNVQCISPHEDVHLAAVRMRDENIGFLPVCDVAGKVVGTLTDRDITVRLVAGHYPPSTPVKEVMSREVIACRATDALAHAEELMARHQKSRMVCLDDSGRLLGIISLSDIAECEESGRAAEILKEVAGREARA
jgi:CBS domain-containing protein